MTRDRKITYRWGAPQPSSNGPVIDLYEAGSIHTYTLPALEKALATEKAATRPPHKCGFAFERDRLMRIRKFEAGRAILRLSQLPNLCDSCALEFATCRSDVTVFGIDVCPSATGKDADKVVECNSHKPVQPQ